MISDFRSEADENCALLGCYAASSGNFLPTFRDDLSIPSSRVKNFGFLTLEEGTDRLSRNVGNYTTRRVITQRRADLLNSDTRARIKGTVTSK